MNKITMIEKENGEGYEIRFPSLKNRLIINKLIKMFYKALVENKKDITIILSDCKPPSFPNIICSISGLSELYKKKFGFSVNIITAKNSYLDHTGISQPYSRIKNKKDLNEDIFDKVIIFKNETDIDFISHTMLEQLQSNVICSEGVLDAASWCLNEIMDNVLNHSESVNGCIMAQIHKKQKHLVFTIFDNGLGLYNTLKKVYALEGTMDGLRMSIQQGVTRDKKLGQGNGMWGLHNIINVNGGVLTIASGSAAIVFDSNKGIENEYCNLAYPSKKYNTTLIDFMIDFSKYTNVKRALNDYEPYEYLTAQHEKMENQEGLIVFNVKENTIGTGTRKSGRKARTQLINIERMEKTPIIIDFENIDRVTSSFADEFIGKLTVIYKIEGFYEKFIIINYNVDIQNLINKAIDQRNKTK